MNVYPPFFCHCPSPMVLCLPLLCLLPVVWGSAVTSENSGGCWIGLLEGAKALGCFWMLQRQCRLWLFPALFSHRGKAFSSGLGSCISPELSKVNRPDPAHPTWLQIKKTGEGMKKKVSSLHPCLQNHSNHQDLGHREPEIPRGSVPECHLGF